MAEAAAGGGGPSGAKKMAAEIRNKTRVVFCQEDLGEVSIQNPKADDSEAPKTFTFDACYGPSATQRAIYDRTAAPVVASVLEGFNGTIFAYGQTGAGKTHTMEGLAEPPEERGIMPNAFKHIFDTIGVNQDPQKQFLVRASYLEIYNEEIRDLLSKDPSTRLKLKERVDTGVYVEDLTSFVVKSVAEIDSVLQAGKKNRSTGATLMNDTSSRSHAIFTVTVETSGIGEDGEGHIRVGKLNMVDLAGSERQSKTGATGQRLKEATKINLSLSALGNVISALVDSKSSHIPYRDSKLTRLLQDSLGGNTKTLMIANCGPAGYNYDESLSTLRYANRAKQIKNKPRINEDPKDAMLREFQEEIERLRRQLAEREGTQQRTIRVDGKEVDVPSDSSREAVEQRIREVQQSMGGISEEEAERIREEARREREEMERRAAEERERLLQEQARTEEEKEQIRRQLQEREEHHRKAAEERERLERQLTAMQEKLLHGGEIHDKAKKQESELRRAEMELEERRRQESELTRELEEANILMEEQYASMSEEVEVKTRKLKKVFSKWQAAKTEIRDLQEEFQREREDMLSTIRELNRTLKLKQALLEQFVPPQEVEKMEQRATLDTETGEWTIHRVELSGNALRPRRPTTLPGTRRAETEFARAYRKFDSTNPRFRAENVAQLDLEPPLRTTADFDPGVRERITMLGDDQATMLSAHEQPTPYRSYAEADPDRQRRRRGRGDYPQARGLV